LLKGTLSGSAFEDYYSTFFTKGYRTLKHPVEALQKAVILFGGRISI